MLKKRVWTCVVYPDSLPADWIDLLKQSGLKCAISPLHDRDYNPELKNTIAQVAEENREPKKPHYHLILVYGNTTTFNNVSKFTQGVLCGTIPQALESVEGMYRYFTHKDNPEKAQYSEKDIQTFNGFNIRNFKELKSGDRQNIKIELVKIIIEKDFIEYADFMNYLISLEDQDYFDVASTQTVFFKAYLASLRHSALSRRTAKETLKKLEINNE